MFSFVIVDNYIPHFFNDRISEILISILIGLGSFILIQFSLDSVEKKQKRTIIYFL